MIEGSRHLCWLLALAMTSGCSSAAVRSGDSVQVVEAEGWAAVDPNDHPETRRRAIADAQRTAVEKAVGLFLAASIRVDAAVAVRQRLDARSSGVIRGYDVLAERFEGESYKVRIRAMVARSRDLGADVASAPPPDSPELRLDIDGSAGAPGSWVPAVASLISERLSTRGFRVAQGAASPGRSELVVRGRVRTFPIANHHLGPFQSYRATVHVEVTDPLAGVILSQSHESAGIGIDSESASAEAVRGAGNLAAAALSRDMTTYLWQRQ